ncbi:MAG: ATP-dependent DNA helicase RecQ, partial [Clostridiaceae bacterium]|nr:ATP-dependent DNA helicase RecQ [Clostridiaceae bacterium]
FEILGEEINLTTVVINKLHSFIQFAQSKRKYLTFDEYLVLEKFVIEQYKRIIIIDNNLYSSFYPLGVNIEQNILDALLTHFDKEVENNEQEIGDLSRYLEIYSNLQCINNKYYVVYNPIGIASNYTIISLWNEGDNFQQEQKQTSEQIHTIYAELDYLDLVIKVQNASCGTYFLRIEAENEIKHHYLRKISILAEVYNSTKFILSQSAPYQYVYKKRSEFKDILKKYWGYNDFRTLKCYDIAELENGTKKIVHVSQEEVVTVVIEQCEKCIGGETFKDVFVTAPTGAGKSVMFQVPAIFLAENHQLLTIVISPLIGLMKDQVASLKIKNYISARTINSDINPILKQEIIEEVKEGTCNILYISPETLLSRSDIEMLIGERKIGLLVVDEAHIVTTWGKQFRPDYWYLGDHVAKLRKKQKERKGHSFVVATFTATSIYGGIENMYQDTKDSLNLFTPLTYLGIVRREDLDVVFERSEKIPGRDEYELRKFEQLAEKIEQAIILNKRVLVYFPTVQLIKRFYRYCHTKDFYEFVTIYHGQMDKYEKDDSFNEYITRKKIVMLATKAFGMGIDIDDIELVLHFAPTGNVCDYIQEIGRAARRTGLSGTAHYNFMSNDFKHINRLHGLSAIQHYQLIEVIRKILELFREQINSPAYTRFTRRRNELLVDATSFSHVFENDFTDE